MNLSYTEKKFIIDKLYKEGWKDKDIKRHLEELDKNLIKVTHDLRKKHIQEETFKRSNEYFKEEFKRLFD